jgi:hypothetical protein
LAPRPPRDQGVQQQLFQEPPREWPAERHADRIALPVGRDPIEARARVLRLVDELGFGPVDAGGIEESWRQQPGTPCYTQDYNAVQLKAALAAAVRGRVPEYRRGGRCGESVFSDVERSLMVRVVVGTQNSFILRHTDKHQEVRRQVAPKLCRNCVRSPRKR